MTTTAPEVELEDDDLDHAFSLVGPKQLKSIAMSRKYTVALWVGAVSAGKTFASLIAFLIAVAFAPRGEIIVIIGKTLQTIERNVLTPLQSWKLFGPLALLTVHTRNSSVAYILGREVELIGANNQLAASRIQGGTFGLVYVDEATLLPEGFWEMLLTRLRVKGARMLATTNPASKNHWLKKIYIADAETHDMIVFHFVMDDNPSLEPEYVDRMKRSFVGVFYKRFILGLWTNAEGAVYDMWNELRHVIRWEDLPPIDRLLAVGVDYGTGNASSAILLGLTAETDDEGRWTPRLVLIDEWRYDSHEKDENTGLERPRMAPVQQSEHIRNWLASRDRIPEQNTAWGMRMPMLYVDPAAAEIREQLKFDKTQNTAADNAVKEGIADISSLLVQGRLIVTDRVRGFIDEVTEYTWDPKLQEEGEDYPLTENDHSLDAARYAIRSTRAIWLAIFRQAYGLAA